MQGALKTQAERPEMDRSSAGSTKAERFLLTVGGIVLRYGIVLFLVVFGLAKWTRAEALGIQPLVAHSPLMFWIYKLTDVQHGSELIGVTELIIAALMAVRPFKPAFSAVGSLLAIPMFLTTLSFLVTTPGLDPHSADAGFLMKDLILLGAACWSAGEALQAVRLQNTLKNLTPIA